MYILRELFIPPVMLLIKEWMKCFQKEKSFHLILKIR